MSRLDTIALYRALLRESKKFHSYYYRNYALRKIKHEFRIKRTLKNQDEISKQLVKGQENLDIIKRQVLIDNLYKRENLIIEKDRANS